jgi:hypothetical protein
VAVFVEQQATLGQIHQICGHLMGDLVGVREGDSYISVSVPTINHVFITRYRVELYFIQPKQTAPSKAKKSTAQVVSSSG